MSNVDQAIEQLHSQWDSAAAQELIRDLVTAIWQAGGPDEQTRGQAAAIRQALQEQLLAASWPVEQLALLNLSYALEQGLGNRDEALDVARRAEALSRQGGTPLERVRAVFQVAKALLYVDRNGDAVRWTEQGLP